MCEKATELRIKIAGEEMTQNQIAALLDFVQMGENLIIRCYTGAEWQRYEFEASGIVVSKEPHGCLPRQITKVNLSEEISLLREQRSDNDFTNWAYINSDKELKLIVSAVTIEK